MSLHALAGHMASKGRGSDSMLVHMTPEEVQSLQVLALKGGGTLTINPDTGLPEANFLKKMLPMIAGAALNFFAPGLGSAVGGMFGLGAAAGTGIAVGGISALATGSLSRGLMAGLGAYGGASLAGGLQNLGATAVAPEAMAAANASADPIMSLANAKEVATAAGIAPAAGAEAAKQGLAMAANNPKSFMTAMGGPAKALGAAYAAATPVLAGEMVPTTTQMPDSAASKAYIRPKRFDPYTQQMVSYDPILASEFGNRRLSDFTSGDGTPGSASGLMSLDSRRPAGMASGGIVALAEGGISADQAQKLIEAQYATIGRSGVGAGANQIDQSGLQGWTDALVRGDFRPEDLSSRFSSAVTDYMAQNPNDQYTQYVTQFRANQPAAQQAPAFTNFNASQINDYIANNNLDAAGVTAATKQFNVDPNAVINAQNAQETVSNIYRNVLGRDPDPVGLQYWTNQVTSGQRTGQEMYQEFLKSAQSILGTAGAKEIFRPGISLEDAVKPFAGYSSADKRNIADEWVRNTLGREVTDADRQQQWYKDATSAASMNTYDAAQNIFGQFQNYAAKTGQSQADALANARSILAAKNLTEADVLAQTGKSLSELVRGTNLNLGLFQASQLNAPGSVFDLNSLLAKAKPVIPAAVTGVPDGYYGNPSGPAPTPGDITRNPDGTVTVHPNIPGRPTGGFSGMQQVKDAYTAGGGSLGYTPYAPKTLQEFQDRYTNTGGSKQAYDFLANKGAADIKRPITKTGELMLPYADIMGLRRQRPAGARAPVVEEKEVVAAPTAGTEGAANGGVMRMALGGLGALAGGGQAGYNLGGYSDGGRLLRGPGDGVSDSIPATIGDKQPARLADGEFVVPARIVSELGNGSTEAGARKLYAMMDRVQKARGKTTGKNRVAANTRSEKFLPA
jgi:hypothetical protein